MVAYGIFSSKDGVEFLLNVTDKLDDAVMQLGRHVLYRAYGAVETPQLHRIIAAVDTMRKSGVAAKVISLPAADFYIREITPEELTILAESD